jgi:hypothetical protein
MEEKKLVERPLMSEEEFKDYIDENKVNPIDEFQKNNTIFLTTFEAVGRFKSVRRAIRRGLVSLYGAVLPKRPFNNKANTCKRKGHHSRVLNERKKMIYEQFRYRKEA